MQRFRAEAALLAALLAAPTAVAPAAAATEAVSAPRAPAFAAIPFYAPEKMWLLYSPFVEYLRQKTGEPWELKLFANHDETVEAVCNGSVDVALLGPVPLGRAYRACGAAPFLVPFGRDGQPLYHAMLVTGDPAVASVGALRGRKIGFFKGSTAAHILPLKMLHDAALGPGSYEATFFESQDRLVTALLERRIAAAGIKEALYRRFEKEGLSLLQASEALPNFSFVASPLMPSEGRERFAAALLALRPLSSPADAQRVAGWDDEIKSGFTRPAPDFLPAVLRLHALSETLTRDAR